jgi:DNA repair exonuclease SbcCD ATPase subunit
MRKKLHKGAMFSDIHFGKKSNSVTHNSDCIEFIDWFCEKTVKEGCDYIAFLGDWYEMRSAINSHTLNYSHKGAGLLNSLGLPVYFIIGNHDLYYRNSRDIHSAVTHEEFENFTIVNNPLVVDDIKNKALFCPYLFPEEYPSLAQYLNVPFWAGHFEFRGFVITGYNHTMKSGPNHKDFKGPKHIVSGHFHKRQHSDNVTFMGNAFPMDFSDAGDSERGMMVYDHAKDRMSFIDWENAPQYVKIRLADLCERDESQPVPKKSRVRCVIDEPLTYEETNKLKETMMTRYGLREFIPEESPEVAMALTDTEIAVDLEDMKLESVDELVVIMLTQIDTEHFDSDLLVELYRNLKIDDRVSSPQGAGGSLNFMSLTMRNFMAFGNNTTEINLDRPGTTLIMGKEVDNALDEERSNGVGKSTIIEAITYALYGRPLSEDIAISGLINNMNGKNMEVSLTFEKDGTYYHIVRGRRTKTSGNIKYYFKEGSADFGPQDEKTLDSVANTNKAIERAVGMPHELFIRIIVFSALHTPFLKLPTSHASQPSQKRIIEELFDLTKLSEKAEMLKAQIKENNQSFEIKSTRLEQLKGEHQRHNAQIESARTRVSSWKEDNERQIERLEGQLEESRLESRKYKKQVSSSREEAIHENREKVHDLMVKMEKLHKERKEYKKNVLSARRRTIGKLDDQILLLGGELEKISGIDVEAETRAYQKLKECQEVIREISYEQRDIEKAQKDLETKKSELEEESNLLKKNKCPYCLQRHPNAKTKLAENQGMIEEKAKHLEKLAKAALENQTEIDAVTKLEDSTKALITVANQEQLLNIGEKIARLEEQTKELRTTIGRLEGMEFDPESEDDEEHIGIITEMASIHRGIPNISQLLQIKNKMASMELQIYEAEDSTSKLESIGFDPESEDEEGQMSMIAEMAKVSDSIPSLNSFLQINGRISSAESRIGELRKAINPFLEPLKELEGIELEPVNTKELDGISNTIEHQKFLLKLLTKKDSFVRKTLLHKHLPYLNARLKMYINELGLSYSAEFTNELTVKILRFGRPLEFGNLSNGQHTRINLALSLAFRDVLQQIHARINVCMLDEVLDVGLDSAGIRAASEMLKSIAVKEEISMYIITHSDKIDRIFDNVLVVQMEKGFSYIKEN